VIVAFIKKELKDVTEYDEENIRKLTEAADTAVDSKKKEEEK